MWEQVGKRAGARVGGRESVEPHFELYETDDSVISDVAGNVLRKFLPAVFPGKYENGTEPEWEWVRNSPSI